jgi:hypothetical protein
MVAVVTSLPGYLVIVMMTIAMMMVMTLLGLCNVLLLGSRMMVVWRKRMREDYSNSK